MEWLEKGGGFLYCISVRFLCFSPILVLFLVSCDSDGEAFRELYEERVNGEGLQSQKNQYVLMNSQGSENSVSDGSAGEVLDLFEGIVDCRSCPPSLGYLIIESVLEGTRNEDLGLTDFCQGYLLEEDIFLVPFYCLPDTVQSVGDSCNEIQVILPQIDNDRPVRVLRCKQLTALPSTEIDVLSDSFQLSWAALELKDRVPERFIH